jgi:DNA-binding NtrC family response regulator
MITDRNPHVRRYISRELTAAGYRVREAESGAEVIRRIYRNEAIDLVVLDPDLPDVDPALLLRRLRNRIPFLPVVIHAFATDVDDHPDDLKIAAFVEKRGSSIDRLKEVVADVLKRTYPNRMAGAEQSGVDPA